MTSYRRHSTALKLQRVHAHFNGEGSYKKLAARHDLNHSLWYCGYRSFSAVAKQHAL
jgi:transposase-like protein